MSDVETEDVSDLRGKLMQSAQLGLELVQVNANLKEQLSSKNELLEAKDQEMQGLLEENHVLKMRLETKEKLEREYDADLSILHSNMKKDIDAAADAVRQELLGQVAILEDRKKKLELELSASRTENKELAETCERLKLDLERAESRAGPLDDSLLSMPQSHTEELRAQLVCLLEEKRVLLEQHRSLEAKLSDMATLVMSAREDCEEWKTRSENAESLVADLRKRTASQEEQLMELKIEKDGLLLEKSNPSKKGNSMFSELNDHRVKLETQLVAEAKRREALVLEKQELKSEVDLLRRRLTCALTMTAFGVPSNDGTTALYQELDVARRDLTVAKSRIAQLEQRLSTAEAQTPAARNAIAHQLQTELSQLESEAQQLRLERASAQDQLNSEKRFRLMAEKDNSKLQKENQDMKLKLEARESRKGSTEERPQRRRRLEQLREETPSTSAANFEEQKENESDGGPKAATASRDLEEEAPAPKRMRAKKIFSVPSQPPTPAAEFNTSAEECKQQ